MAEFLTPIVSGPQETKERGEKYIYIERDNQNIISPITSSKSSIVDYKENTLESGAIGSNVGFATSLLHYLKLINYSTSQDFI